MQTYEVRFRDLAIRQLSQIQAYIAKTGGEATARRFVGNAFRHMEGFATAPHRGSLREEIRPGLRLVGWRRKLSIAFVVDNAALTVTVLAVYYRGRDVERAARRLRP